MMETSDLKDSKDPLLERLVFSVEEVCQLLGLSRGKTYELIQTGEIPSIRFGRRILIPRNKLYDLLGINEPEGMNKE